MPVGSGLLELKAFATPNMGGLSAEYSHRLTGSLSAFGAGYAGVRVGGGVDAGAMAGLRLRF